jgi:hypothetical protein
MSMPSSARTSPNVLTRPSVSIADVVIEHLPRVVVGVST